MTSNVSYPQGMSTLHIENTSLDHIAKTIGTPTYVYSSGAIRTNVRALQDGLQEALGNTPQSHKRPPISIHYAVKANSNLAILQLMRQQGIGFDAVSAGELACVLKACGQNDDIARRTIFSGIGKTDEEIAIALRVGVKYICVESAAELDAVSAIAQRLHARQTQSTIDQAHASGNENGASAARIAIRVNPNVDAKSHPYISTGLKENKFGVPMDEAESLCLRAHADPWLRVVGVSCHIGSQITSLGPFQDAARLMAGLTQRLLEAGLPLESVGMGGGLGVQYRTVDEGAKHDEIPSMRDYARLLVTELGSLGLPILLEPGRMLIANAGLLLSRVVRTKEQEGRRFVILDSGMNDLLRPGLYGARHAAQEVEAAAPGSTDDGGIQPQEIVGPVCESGDTFYAACRTVRRRLEAGDLVVLHTAGAYGMSMASNYNGRRRAAEVLVDGHDVRAIRQRESFSVLWQGQSTLDGEAVDDGLAFPEVFDV